MGVLYILDEPTIGLHQRDNAKLIATLTRLRDLGNTVLVVEHDEETIRTADWSSTSAPAPASTAARSSPSARSRRILAEPRSITGAFLRGERTVPMPAEAAQGQRQVARRQGRPRAQPQEHRRRVPARARSSPSPASPGSGKCTLVTEMLYRALAQAAQRRARRAAARTTRSIGVGAPRQGHRDRPDPHRPHAALQPGHLHRPVRADPRAVRGRARVALARLQARPLLLQRQGRPLRELQGRRDHQDRDAVPAGRLRAVRGLQGQALQPRGARDPLQGPDRSPTCSR